MVVHLEDTVAAGPTVSTARKGKKRARIDSTSPSPASEARRAHPTGARGPNATPSRRAQLPPAQRPFALRPVNGAMSEAPQGRMAAITAALQSIPGAGILAPGGCTAPTRRRGVPQSQAGSSTRPVLSDENANPARDDLIFGMDLDLPLEHATRPPPYGVPLQSLDINRLRFPEAFQHMGPLPEGPEERDEYEDPLLVSPEHRPHGIMSVRDRPPTPHPLRSLSTDGTTPARTVSHSAAALAASFTPSQPIPIPRAANANGANTATATYRAAPHQLAPGAMGGHQFTNVPPGGFPVIHRANPDGLFTGLTQARGVALREENAIIAIVHNLGFPARHEVRPVLSALTSVVQQVSGELNPLVVAPDRDPAAPNNRLESPIAFGIIGLTVEGALRVLARSSWSARALTIHVRRATIEVSPFMFVISDFTHDHNGSILNAVFAVFSGPVVLPLIVHYTQSHPDYANASNEDAARAILASLEVRVSTLENGNIQAAVFCAPPTLVPSSWVAWRARVAACPFTHPLNSTGIVRRIAPCAGCYGEDHPTHLCPFDDVVGWNAPAAGTTWAQPGTGSGTAPPPTQPPPPPPPAGGFATRTRSQTARRAPDQPNFNPHRRDYRGGGDGRGSGSGAGPSRGGGSGYGGNGGAGAGAVGF